MKYGVHIEFLSWIKNLTKIGIIAVNFEVGASEKQVKYNFIQ